MRLLGIIPARAGSKRLPDKNISDLGGRPLIDWSIQVGLKTCSAGLIVSTDSTVIAAVAHVRDAAVHMRSPELSRDRVSTEEVVRAICGPVDAPQWKGITRVWDAVLVLQPTSPFRTEEDVAGAVAVMEKTNADAVISCIPFQDRDALFRLGHADRLRPAHTPQDMVYVPNGAIYLIRAAAVNDDWYGHGTYAYRMPLERSLDIDWHTDMDAARAALEK